MAIEAEEAVVKRIKPYSAEAEQSVIGSMVLDTDAILVAMQMLTRDDFYLTQYGIMFEAITALYDSAKPVDLVMLQEKLQEMSAPPEVSSLENLSNMMMAVPTSANVRYYAEIVKNKSLLRKLINICESIANTCYQDTEPAEDILEETEKKVFSLLQSRKVDDFVPIRQIVVEALDKIDKATHTQGAITGLATGFTDLDQKLSGLQPSDLILVAARPAMGKTAFVLNIAQYVAFHSELPVAIFSLEMSREQLATRLFAMESRIDAQKFRNGSLSDNDWEKLIDSAGVVGRSKMIIDDTPGITVSELRSKCRKFKLDYDIQLVIIDYLQLMGGNYGSQVPRQQQISEISRSLKQLARELNVPVIALSQLSRQVEQRDGHRPMLSDLRESGAIEQDADVVMFIFREEYYNKDTEKKGIAEITIAKQRNGPIGTVELRWLSQYTKFANLERNTALLEDSMHGRRAITAEKNAALLEDSMHDHRAITAERKAALLEDAMLDRKAETAEKRAGMNRERPMESR